MSQNSINSHNLKTFSQKKEARNKQDIKKTTTNENNSGRVLNKALFLKNNSFNLILFTSIS